MTTPRKEYLKYLKELTDGQYSFEEDDSPDVPDDSWVWAEPPAKEKMKNIIFNGMVEATNLRKVEIKDALSKAKNIQVGSFTIRIRDFYGKNPLEKGTLSFDVFERKTRTPNGQPCSMDYRADLSKDDRFNTRPWITYFNGSGARDVPIDTIVDIVKWMQAVKKLSAFL